MSNVNRGAASIPPTPEMRVRPAPLTTFTLAGETKTIQQILDRESGRFPLQAPTDAEHTFQRITRDLGNMGVRYEDYMKSMPYFLGLLATPDGTVEDSGLCSIARYLLLTTSNVDGGNQMGGVRNNLDDTQRSRMLSRVEGQLEFVKTRLLNNPAAADYFKQLVATANSILELNE